ncbi:MAG TPA: protein kinase [Tepidisphaeraceae bacterium]|nr:protein kinase [Tepidisphaeraceae bacterium]
MNQTASILDSSVTADSCEIVRTDEAGLREIGGYGVTRTITEGQCWLATAPAGRTVVLKTLDDDCLWKGQLHPNIKDRLGRVRELAHTGVANLYGVERDAGLVYMVWEYVDGRPIGEWAARESVGQRDVLLAARELVLALETLHGRGIVHGAIKSSNVITVDEGRGIVLTHVSPWLYSEPDADVRDLLDLFDQIIDARDGVDRTLAQLVDEARDRGLTLRQIAGKLGGMIEAKAPAGSPVVEADPELKVARRVRRRSLIGAVGVGALGIAAGAAVWIWAGAKSPKPGAPVAAPAAAFQPISRATPSPRLPGPAVLPTPMPSQRDPVSLR